MERTEAIIYLQNKVDRYNDDIRKLEAELQVAQSNRVKYVTIIQSLRADESKYLTIKELYAVNH